MAETPQQAPEPPADVGRDVRALMRRAGQASLASALARDESGRPYASLVLVAVDHDASPSLLISDLADHTRNLKANPRAALLFDGTGEYEEPLAGPRATVLGTIREIEAGETQARLKARYLARHPSARAYADFRDFRLVRMEVESAHLVAGFGRIHWLEAGDVVFDTSRCAALAEAEPDIITHMNQDHGDALDLMAAELLGLDGRDWTMVGINPEGFDLRRGRTLARIEFETTVQDPETARGALVRLTKRARKTSMGQ